MRATPWPAGIPRPQMTTQQDDTISYPPQPRLHADVADTASSGTRDNAPEYWVARVVRQMQGCTPSKIDSVIQANLPPREISWSQRPDTLCIPGLEGHLPYSMPRLKWEYDPGFFKGNRLMHPEIPVRTYGIAPEPLAQAHIGHDFLMGMVILCFTMVAILVNSANHVLRTRAKDFFYANTNDGCALNDKDMPATATVLATYMLLCATGGLFALYYAQGTDNLPPCTIPQHTLLAVYTGCIALMFLARRLLSAFINWIFFDKGRRKSWRLDYNFLLMAETLALLPIVAAGICFDMPPHTVLWAGLVIVATAKILLLYKAFTIFMPHFYCFLHLLSYLCALEIMPCLALWVALHGVTEYLTTTI